MGIIRNHLAEMKATNRKEYDRLMQGYDTEDELVRDVCGLSVKAINYAKALIEEVKKRR